MTRGSSVVERSAHTAEVAGSIPAPASLWRPSAHLTAHELACHDGTPYPDGWRVSRGEPLALEFERIRLACGGIPIRVLSAYRTAPHNRAVGGALQSQHVQGRALDLAPPSRWSLERFYAVVRSVARLDASAIHGLGRYPTFVHIDIRPIAASKLVVWSGSRAWADLQ